MAGAPVAEPALLLRDFLFALSHGLFVRLKSFASLCKLLGQLFVFLTYFFGRGRFL
jgi:hypothetical protein